MTPAGGRAPTVNPKDPRLMAAYRTRQAGNRQLARDGFILDTPGYTVDPASPRV